MELATLIVGLAVFCLALAVVSRDAVSSLVAGLVLSARRPFAVGDVIEIGAFVGTVERIELRATICRSVEGKLVAVPNAQILGTALTNHGSSGARRVDLALRVAYGEDLEHVEHIAREAARGVTERRRTRDPEIYFESFGDSAIAMTLRLWVDADRHSISAARSEAIKRVKHAFAAAGITIPFPTRSLDFGVVGGLRLDEVLPDDHHWRRSRHHDDGHGSGVIPSDEIMSATAD